jgi:hypothetical protein
VQGSLCPTEATTIYRFLTFHQACGDLHSINRISLSFQGILNTYFVCGDRVSVVGVVFRIRAGQQRNNGSVPDRMLLFSVASRMTW